MSKNNIVDVYAFDTEIGKVAWDEDQRKTFFQYHPDFLKDNSYLNIFPFILKRVVQTQVFSKFDNASFKGLPPMIADSLPDMFGNLVFKTWLEASQKDLKKISVIEQLAYVANRGMGALAFRPARHIPGDVSINLEEITTVLKKVMDNKQELSYKDLSNASLHNIFKIGTSAGGARPKILVSEDKSNGRIIPGDLEYSGDYHHYLIKLCLDDGMGYNKEIIEYSYYLTAREINISMMPSKLVDEKHFATVRFDRQNGRKQHILTASGMTGWDFMDPGVSSYENLFELALYLKIPYKEIDELFRRMVFNVVFCNTDDHLKNHTFIYNEQTDRWNLSPAYDLNYSLNPLLNYKRISRALSVNNKRVDINLEDILVLADKFTIKNPTGIIELTQNAIPTWESHARNLNIHGKVIQNIKKDFHRIIA